MYTSQSRIDQTLLLTIFLYRAYFGLMANETLSEAVSISVERLMRYCLLSQMTTEAWRDPNSTSKLHLTRFGVLLIDSISWLCSLFDDTKKSIHLLKIWQGFDHPFKTELQEFVQRLEREPFRSGFKSVRHRIGFHGSLSRARENAGLLIFEIDNGNATQTVNLLADMQELALKMIKWFCLETTKPDGTSHVEDWQNFKRELHKIPKVEISPTNTK